LRRVELARGLRGCDAADERADEGGGNRVDMAAESALGDDAVARVGGPVFDGDLAVGADEILRRFVDLLVVIVLHDMARTVERGEANLDEVDVAPPLGVRDARRTASALIEAQRAIEDETDAAHEQAEEGDGEHGIE